MPEHHEHAHHAPQQNLPIIAAGLVIALLIGGVIGHYAFAAPAVATNSTIPTGPAKMDANSAGAKAINYINANAQALGLAGATTKLDGVAEKNGLYEITFDITAAGKAPQTGLKVYTTTDGKTMIIGNINFLNLDKPVPTPTPKPPITKTAKPEVKIFVMSQCPYGVAAQDAMIPVIKLLGNSAAFDMRFIASQNADGTFQSLHGPSEVENDLRQVCISANEPAKYLTYLECFVKKPAAAVNAGDNAAYSAINWTSMAEDCAKEAKVDAAKLKTCVTGTQGPELLSKNIALANQLNIGSSPTITINTADYDGQRSSEDFKTAICSAFTTAPAECSQKLSTASAGTGGVACGT